METLDLVVSGVRNLTQQVKEVRLRARDQRALPAVEAGAHLKVHIPGLDEPRCYSLVLPDVEACRHESPLEYRLGVRLEPDGGGGSRHMHALAEGAALRAEGPRNDFPLEHTSGPVVLLAGGIGITPVLSMAATLAARGEAFQAHYCGASRSQMAYLDAFQVLAGANLSVHAADEPAGRLDLVQWFEGLAPDSQVYVCGPQRLLDAVLTQARAQAWPSCQLHFELFDTAAPQAGDQPFEIELKQSGRVLLVPADQTIADVLEEAGCDPMYDCKRGECGVCTVDVLDGIPDHRDYFLSDAEKAAGKLIQICISRAKSPRLVLDL